MVDKGFRIEKECADNNIGLLQPTFKSGGHQLNEEDCERSRSISSARVHVELVMERLKNFRIMKDEIEWHYLAEMNDIIVVIAGLVNLCHPYLDLKLSCNFSMYLGISSTREFKWFISITSLK